MAKQTINIGTSPDDDTGDYVRDAFDKCNDNFTELYDSVGGSVDSLDDVGDVNAPTPANGDVLTWDDTPGEWVPAAPSGGSNALDDLTDVDAPTPSDGDVLTFDSGSGDWVPAAPVAGGDRLFAKSGTMTSPAEGTARDVHTYGSVTSSGVSFNNGTGIATINNNGWYLITGNIQRSGGFAVTIQIQIDEGAGYTIFASDAEDGNGGHPGLESSSCSIVLPLVATNTVKLVGQSEASYTGLHFGIMQVA